MVKKMNVVGGETDEENLDFSDLKRILGLEKAGEPDEGNLYEKITTKKRGEGVSCLISGGSGSGKTTFMLHVLDDLFTQGEELIFWRGQEIDQWHNAKAEFLIFHHVNDKIEFENADIRHFELIQYKTIDEIFTKAKKDKVNVVYAPSSDSRAEYCDENLKVVLNEYRKKVSMVKYAFWYSFFLELLKLKGASLFFEDLENVAERGCWGLRYFLIGTLANALNYFRQRKISLYATTHRITDIDVRITDRIAFHIYMSKARVHRDSVLSAKKVKRAKIGKAFIEDRRSEDFLVVEFPRREITSLAVKLEETHKTETKVLKELYGEE